MGLLGMWGPGGVHLGIPFWEGLWGHGHHGIPVTWAIAHVTRTPW